MSDANYRIRYKRGDFEVEVQGDKAWVEGKFKELSQDVPIKQTTSAGASISQPIIPKAEDTTLPTSLVEFVKSKGNPSDRTDTDLETLFVYWLDKKEKMSSYNTTDIENCYTEARIQKPANIADVMNRIQGKGHIMVAKEKKDGKKAWVITTTGETYVQQMK